MSNMTCIFSCLLILQPVLQFSTQLDAMQHLKEQLEQRTRIIEANIQRQQEELRQIQEELQRVQGQGLQVRAASAGAHIQVTVNRCKHALFSYSLCLGPS